MATTTTTAKKAPAASSTAKKRTPVTPVAVPTKTSSAVDAVAAGTTLVHEIPIDLIDPHPRNPRQALGDLGELAESIRAFGVIEPATVVPHPDTEGRYLMLLGHRRLAASTSAGRTTIPAIVREDLTPADQLAHMMVENLQRVDLTISEEGAGYQGLLDLGMPKADIVRRTGRAKNTVESRLRIAGMPEPVRRHVDQHRLTIEEALAFTDWRESNPDVYADQLEKLSNPHVMVDVVFGEAKRIVKEINQWDTLSAEWAAKGHTLTKWDGTLTWNDPRYLTKLDLSLEEHAHCPGAQIQTRTTEWDLRNIAGNGQYICADPERFHPYEYKTATTPPGERERTPEQIERDAKWAAEQAQRTADREAAAAVAKARLTWLHTTLTRQGPDAAPAYAALAAVAAEAALLHLMLNTDGDETSLFYNGFYPSEAVVADAVLPVNPLSLMTLALLLTVEAGLPQRAIAIDDTWPAKELDMVISYLQTCAAHGHVLDESETLLIRAAEFALDNQKTEAISEQVEGDDDTAEDAAS